MPLPRQRRVVLHDEVEERGHLLDEDGVEGEQELHDVWQVRGLGEDALDARKRANDRAVRVTAAQNTRQLMKKEQPLQSVKTRNMTGISWVCMSIGTLTAMDTWRRRTLLY